MDLLHLFTNDTLRPPSVPGSVLFWSPQSPSLAVGCPYSQCEGGAPTSHPCWGRSPLPCRRKCAQRRSGLWEHRLLISVLSLHTLPRRPGAVWLSFSETQFPTCKKGQCCRTHHSPQPPPLIRGPNCLDCDDSTRLGPSSFFAPHKFQNENHIISLPQPHGSPSPDSRRVGPPRRPHCSHSDAPLSTQAPCCPRTSVPDGDSVTRC